MSSLEPVKVGTLKYGDNVYYKSAKREIIQPAVVTRVLGNHHIYLHTVGDSYSQMHAQSFQENGYYLRIFKRSNAIRQL